MAGPRKHRNRRERGGGTSTLTITTPKDPIQGVRLDCSCGWEDECFPRDAEKHANYHAKREHAGHVHLQWVDL